MKSWRFQTNEMMYVLRGLLLMHTIKSMASVAIQELQHYTPPLSLLVLVRVMR
jgi:hypothetical protein